MPRITNCVLTAPGQQLDEEMRRNARQNITAMERVSGEKASALRGKLLTVDDDGELADTGIQSSTLPSAKPTEDGMHLMLSDKNGETMDSKWAACELCDDPFPDLP